MLRRSAALSALAVAVTMLVAPAVPARAKPDPRRKILDALEQELQRSHRELKLEQEDFSPPYFVAYRLQDNHHIELSGRYGAVFRSSDRRSRTFSVEVRVGDYSFDNTGKKNFDFDWGGTERYFARTDAPLDDDLIALRNALWLKTDETYKKALAAYHQKKGKRVYKVDDGKHTDSFSREKPVRDISRTLNFPFEKQRWQRTLRRVGLAFRKHPHVFDHQIKITATKTLRYFVNSEGSRIVDEAVIYGIHLYAVTRAKDGMLLDGEQAIYTRDYGDLPREKALLAEVNGLISDLEAVREAPAADPYTGPAILEPEATGVIFHESIGHRLEGHRQDDEKEGRTFKGQIGKKIIPEFLSVSDDPTLERFAKQTLNGYYRFDQEGVRAQRVDLVERGVLKTFLMGRKPIEGLDKSNGHGRASGGSAPVARQGNLIIEAHEALSREALKKRLIEEARRQKKPYGLILKDISGGSTNTSTYGYQAFKGRPRMVYRVWVEDGREELIRGVEMVGTPLSSVNRIVAAGDRSEVFNGYCGAESGYVPVSTVAPAVLINEIELQRAQKGKERPPILESPWQGK